MKKAFIKATGYCMVLLFVLYGVNNVFRLKNGSGLYGSAAKFYELEPDSVDVLILGSSHAFADINTGTLWDEYGIASFVLAGSSQPMWNTYYYLKESLKTQRPRLIILEAYMTTHPSEYTADFAIIDNTFGLRWSRDKIEAIKISSPESRWREFLIEYFQYHARYTDLSREDFFGKRVDPLYTDWKGYTGVMATLPFSAADVSNVVERTPLYDKTERYYRMTIELAQEHDIPIFIAISPYAGITAGDQAIFNTAQDIAQEYGVPFVNYNLLLDDIGMDYSTDVAEYSHLNFRGNQKYTRALGACIKSLFDIPDRRGDPAYQSWERNAAYITCLIQNQELLETTDLNEIITAIQNPNFTLIVTVDGSCTTGDETLGPLFDAIGIPRNGEGGFWCITNPIGITHCFSGSGEAERYLRPDYHDIYLARTLDKNTQRYVNTVMIDNVIYQSVSNGVNLHIYNNLTQSLVDSFGFDMDESYQLVRTTLSD